MQDEPRYMLLAREAEMLFAGGFGLEKDPQRSGRAGQTCSCSGTGRDVIPVPLGIMAGREASLSLTGGRRVHTGPLFCQAGYPHGAGLGGGFMELVCR